jgi:predicted MFS family arabinose efflux permease
MPRPTCRTCGQRRWPQVADRFSRRTVLIVCDLLRAVAVAAMLLPGTSITVPIALVALIATIEPVAAAALTAATAEVLDEPQLITGTTLYGTTGQLAQVGGYLTWGLLVAALSPTGCLLLDVVTFLASALLV